MFESKYCKRISGLKQTQWLVCIVVYSYPFEPDSEDEGERIERLLSGMSVEIPSDGDVLLKLLLTDRSSGKTWAEDCSDSTGVLVG
jgi:hypothetical protein